MFFFLSKTLGYLARPLVIVCILFLTAWLVKRPKVRRLFLYAGIFAMILFSNEFIANEAMRAWEIEPTRFVKIPREYAYGIVLSGATKTEVGPDDRVYIASAADRVNHTLQLYKMGRIKKILISGGSGRLVDVGEREANELATLFRLMGVPSANILVDNESRNTHESAILVKQMLEGKARPADCLLITSGYHMRRSLACFEKVGFHMDTFSADIRSHQRSFSFDILMIPKVEAILVWQSLLKEWTGYVAYWMAGYI